MASMTITQELHNMLFSENYASTVELTNIDQCINSRELYHLCKYPEKTCNLVTNTLIDKKVTPFPVVFSNSLRNTLVLHLVTSEIVYSRGPVIVKKKSRRQQNTTSSAINLISMSGM